MRNIRIFDEYSDYLATQEIVSGTGKYVEDIFPGFVYVRELAEKGIYAFYNGENSEEYEFGDVIYYDGTPKLKKVYYSAFTPSMGEKVGLVVVPTALSPDGNARIMAFGSITTEMQPSPTEPVANASKPESKDVLLGESMSYVKAFTQWHDNMADENQTVYTCVPGFYLDGGSSPKGNGDSVAKASVPGSEGKTSYYESPISLSNSSEMSPVNITIPQIHWLQSLRSLVIHSKSRTRHISRKNSLAEVSVLPPLVQLKLLLQYLAQRKILSVVGITMRSATSADTPGPTAERSIGSIFSARLCTSILHRWNPAR